MKGLAIKRIGQPEDLVGGTWLVLRRGKKNLAGVERDLLAIDGLVVDLPTAFYVTAVQVPNGKIIGQFQAKGTQERFGMVFQKGNPLVTCVNNALAQMKRTGVLKRIQQIWLAKVTGAPVLR